MKKVIGALLVALPLMVVVVMGSVAKGIFEVLAVTGVVVLVMGCIFGGLWLLFD